MERKQNEADEDPDAFVIKEENPVPTKKKTTEQKVAKNKRKVTDKTAKRRAKMKKRARRVFPPESQAKKAEREKVNKAQVKACLALPGFFEDVHKIAEVVDRIEKRFDTLSEECGKLSIELAKEGLRRGKYVVYGERMKKAVKKYRGAGEDLIDADFNVKSKPKKKAKDDSAKRKSTKK